MSGSHLFYRFFTPFIIIIVVTSLLIFFAIERDIDSDMLPEVRGSMLLITGLMIILALIPSFLLTRHFTKSINSIRRNLKEFGGGKGDNRQRERKDELENLAQDLGTHFSDVNERIVTLSSARDRLASILGGMVEGIIAIDENEQVLYINSFAASILGAERSRCEGKPLWEISRHAVLSEAILSALGDESSSINEARLVDERGDRFIKIYTSKIPGSSDQSTGVVVVLQDVTTLRKLADVRQDMITNVSHEFKTPLTAIMGIAETLIDSQDIEEETQRSFLHRILNQATRMQELATDVLEISRIESREGKAHHKPRDIRLLVKEVCDNLSPYAALKHLEVQYEQPHEDVTVNCEEESILQIANNLLDNAIKYSREGGKIFVRVARERNQAVIEVRDTGQGIDPSEQDRIFERFYRTNLSRTPKTRGTGLGLSIIKSIVSSYEGNISVDSKPGVGSKFTVRLPLYRTEKK